MKNSAYVAGQIKVKYITVSVYRCDHAPVYRRAGTSYGFYISTAVTFAAEDHMAAQYGELVGVAKREPVCVSCGLLAIFYLNFFPFLVCDRVSS